MKIFLTMAETAEALGYSHEYFQCNWRTICANLRAPFPVNHHHSGSRRWRRAEIEAYAAGTLFDPPDPAAPGRRPETVRTEDVRKPVDWTERFSRRARAVLLDKR